MSITGGIQVGGNLGAIAGGLLAGSPSFQIGPRSPFKGMSQEELNKLKEWDSRPGDLQKYYEQQNRPGPQLPFAGIPGDVGNFGGLIAQQPQNPSQDMSGFEKLLEGLEEEQRMRMRGTDQMQVGPNQFVTYPIIQRRPF